MKRFLILLISIFAFRASDLPPVSDIGVFYAGAASTEMSKNKKSSSKKKKSSKQTAKTSSKKKKTTSKGASSPKTSSEAQRLRDKTQKDIEQTRLKIEQNEAEVKKNMALLTSLQADIRESNNDMAAVKAKINNTNAQIASLEQDISALQERLDAMRAQYGEAIKKLRLRKGQNSDIAFIFAAENFYQGWRRLRYIKQYGEWRKKKAAEIRADMQALNLNVALLADRREEQSALLANATTINNQLASQYDKQNTLVANLKSQGSSLKSLMKRKQQELNSLNNKVAELIAAEEEARRKKEREEQLAAERAAAEAQRKAQEQQTAEAPANESAGKSESKTYAEARKRTPRNASASGFAAEKGKLPNPASGSFRITGKYGRQTYADLDDVEYINTGIDAEVSEGAVARAVYQGKVSGVYKLDGFSTVVIVAHDGYYTVYGNLENASVKSGDNVQAGQSLGKVGVDADKGSGRKLHFEVWKNREKQDPQLWLAS